MICLPPSTSPDEEITVGLKQDSNFSYTTVIKCSHRNHLNDVQYYFEFADHVSSDKFFF